ncbi:hypothetical protein [Streptomyces sp. NPDC101234]|uniref:hypothetical protein n=1 Tax=Streptomyces sp. NPDC101234 TaxID=3366138 RepID=UPI0037F171B3
MRQGLRIVRVDQDDEPRLAALHRRCSAAARWHRYHRAMGDPDTCLGPLLSRPHSVHLAVQDSRERLVATGHLLSDDGDAEAALPVEDTWQNRGLGARLPPRRRPLRARTRDIGLALTCSPTRRGGKHRVFGVVGTPVGP